MILFDYGETLLWERDRDFLQGYRAMFPYITKNPNRVTPEEVYALSEGIFQEAESCRKFGYEIHEFQLLRATSEIFGLEFSVSFKEVERVIWTNASKYGTMLHIEELLKYLKKEGIRTGVISNIGWSGGALKERIDQFLPKNNFEFVIASSEYAIRKPNPLIFRIALQKAGLKPSEVWFCGDSVEADIKGAHGAGIFPVYYDNANEKDLRTEPDVQIDFNYLHIHDWVELIDTLTSMSQKDNRY